MNDRQSIVVTERAKSHINSVCEQTNSFAVSLSIKGSGCAGFEYKWNTINEDELTHDNFTTIDTDGAYLVIDNRSFEFIFGSKIDYVSEGLGYKMAVINPNVETSCGCGASVNFKSY